MREGRWQLRYTAVGAIREKPVRWADWLSDPATDEQLLIRLKVWNSGEEAQALYDFAYFDYRAEGQ